MSASTNVCQYFLQGKCKFGAKCHNLHPGTQANAFNSLTGRPTLSNNQYGQQRQQQMTKTAGYNRFALLSDDRNLGTWHGSSSNGGNTAFNHTGNVFSLASKRSSSDTTTLNPFLTQPQHRQLEDMGEDDLPSVENIKSIIHSDVMDMSNCATLWLLTNYSPIGGISLFPEFEDVSADEMRWEHCLAHSTNGLHEYNNKLQQFITKRKSLISQLACIKGEDMSNRVMSVKDKLLSITSPLMQNPIPQSNTKPLVVASSLSQPSTKVPTKPVTTVTPTTPKASSQNDPINISSSSSGAGIKTSSATPTKQDNDAFNADKFTLGKIPTCPPPPELC